MKRGCELTFEVELGLKGGWSEVLVEYVIRMGGGLTVRTGTMGGRDLAIDGLVSLIPC